MSVPKKLTNYLKKNKISFEIIPHKTVYTSFDLAKTLKVDPEEIAKVLLVRLGKKYALAVLPASKNLNLKKLIALSKQKQGGLAKEQAMKKVFKIKPGTITPFGGFHKLPVYLDRKLAGVKKIIVSALSYTDSLKIKTADFIWLENPVLGSFSKKK